MISKPKAISGRLQGGQALVETLVIAIVLIPAVLIIVLLGKLQSIQMASIAASRTVAFECTIRPEDCRDDDGKSKLKDEAVSRHLSRAEREIFTNDNVPDLTDKAERHQLWTNQRGQGLVANAGDVTLEIFSQSFDATMGVAGGHNLSARFPDAVNLLDNLAGPARFGLNMREGLLVAQVNTQVRTGVLNVNTLASWIPDNLFLKGRTAILTNDWAASGPTGSRADTVAARVDKGAKLNSILEAGWDLAYLPTVTSISVMGALGLDNAAGNFKYRQIDMDKVPSERLDGIRPTVPSAESNNGG